MLNSYLDSVLGLYERTDAIIITDCKGFIEYSIMFSNEVNNLKSAHVTGMHILENYPSLTEETSSIMRVLKMGRKFSTKDNGNQLPRGTALPRQFHLSNQSERRNYWRHRGICLWGQDAAGADA